MYMSQLDLRMAVLSRRQRTSRWRRWSPLVDANAAGFGLRLHESRMR